MQYTGRSILVFVVLVLSLAAAKDQWRTEVNIQGRALKGFAFKILLTTAPYLCDVKCEQEITCQSYNYNRENKICELNNRTKEARPENFISAPAWFYIRRLNGRGRYIYLDVSTVEWFLGLRITEGDRNVSKIRPLKVMFVKVFWTTKSFFTRAQVYL